MLVITRKPGERIVISPDIELCVVSVQGKRVQLGLRAPRSVTIHRQEVHQARTESRRSTREDEYTCVPLTSGDN